jgi:NADPH2:quinone reductase
MRALMSVATGGPDTLELCEVRTPLPGPGQILIDVRACGVNFPDGLIIEDRYQYRPERPFAPGGEVAGVVAAHGPGVIAPPIGARVIGFPMWGGFAEAVVVDMARVVEIPEAMPFDDAAAFTLTYATTIHALKDRAALAPGDTLLVLGAAGGAGISAVELGKAMGARVIAAVSSEEKLAFARAHGADDGIVYPRGPFDAEGKKALAQQFKAVAGPEGANVIYDAVGGDYAEAALRAIAWEGRFLVVGFPAGIPKIPLNLALLKGCQIIGVFWGSFTERTPQKNAANITELMRLYLAGQIKPAISARFQLAEGAEALKLIGAREAQGKIVVTMP